MNDDRRSLIMSEIMPPEKANFGGNIHGGYILFLLDRVSFTLASRYSRKYAVTVSVDEVIFKKPIHVGELVTFYANINYVGTSSMEIGIKVTAENLLTGEVRHTNSCYFTFVATDKNGKPAKVEPLTLNTPEEKRRFEEAKLRRELRQQLAEEHKKRKAKLRDSL